MKTAEFGQPCAALPEPGRCRICGCTNDRACALAVTYEGCAGGDHSDCPTPVPFSKRSCGWTDNTQTLCDNPDCIAAAKREIGIS
jgi:hypothetical protein